MKTLKIGLIGPTNIKKISKLTKKPVGFFIKKAKAVGKLLAEFNCEVWANGDKGMVSTVALAYKKNGGRKLTILYPHQPSPWPNKHVRFYKKYANKIKKESSWFWANYNVVTQPDLCICVGLSAGTLSELAYIKWNYQLKCGRLKRLIAIKELLRARKLPPEIEVDIKKILIYINKVGDLKGALAKYSKEVY
ncbi:hypothetical protein AMJ48_02455 [Parcubacteria bacterium DG_74_1]|nr:MAG: hypothetical protein AMJ48_02455 [Parcubacteria bacterium DG_74_1]